MSSLFNPRKRTPALSPARPSSNDLLNISIPVTTVFCVGLIPIISISSLTLRMPLSILPVATVPRPSIENTSSIGIKNGFSVSRTGSGIDSSKALTKSRIALAFSSLTSFASSAFRAEPRIIGVVSPGNSYLFKSSLISCSTKSISSGSSTMSVLFKKTITAGTPT